MRETQILRGLHKARALRDNRFAGGFVPNPTDPSADRIALQNAQTSANSIVHDASWKQGMADVATMTGQPAPGQPAQTMAHPFYSPMSMGPSIGPSLGPNVRRPSTPFNNGMGNFAGGYAPESGGLRRGVAQLEGPGTTTSDSIPANLSRGEAVLPAKTVQKVGANNIARLIEQTNGAPPARGLRGGMHASDGAIDRMAKELAARTPAGNSPVMGDMAGQLGARPSAPQAPAGQFKVTPEAAAVRNEAAAKIKTPPVAPQPAATGNPLGAAADAIDFNGVKPQPVPADTRTKGRAQSAWGAAKGLFSGEPATPGPTAAPQTAADVARAYNPKLSVTMPSAGAVRSAAETGGKWVTRGGKVLAPVGAAMDASDVVDVATDKNMGKLDVVNEVASKAGKWGAAGAGAATGGALGALAGGGVLTPVTAPLGAIAGGLAGYFGGDAAIKAGRGALGTETSDPSQRSNGVVSQALGQDRAARLAGRPTPSQPAAAQPAAAPGELTDAQLQANNADKLAAADRSLKAASFERPAAPVLGAERNVDTLAGTRDVFSAANSKDGKAVWQTVSTSDALARNEQAKRDDRAERDAAADRAMNGPTSYKAQLRSLQEQRAQDALQQTREAALWNPRAAELYKSLMQTQGTVQGHQLSHDATLRSAAMSRDASMRGHDVSRLNNQDSNTVANRGNELQYQGTMNRLQYDQGQKAIERGVEGEKALTEDLKNDPSTFAPNEKGEQVFSQEKAARLSKYISETQPLVKLRDGRTMTLAQARVHAPEEAKAVQQQASNEFALRELAHDYSKEAVAGKGTQTGQLKLGTVRKINPVSDILGNDTHGGGGLKTAAMTPFTGGNVVEVHGVGGRTIALPMDVITAHPQGRAMLESINRLRASQKQPPVDAYGNVAK